MRDDDGECVRWLMPLSSSWDSGERGVKLGEKWYFAERYDDEVKLLTLCLGDRYHSQAPTRSTTAVAGSTRRRKDGFFLFFILRDAAARLWKYRNKIQNEQIYCNKIGNEM